MMGLHAGSEFQWSSFVPPQYNTYQTHHIYMGLGMAATGAHLQSKGLRFSGLGPLLLVGGGNGNIAQWLVPVR
jgi:hypothetical protein